MENQGWSQDLVLQWRQVPTERAMSTSVHEDDESADKGGMATLPEDVFEQRKSHPAQGRESIKDTVQHHLETLGERGADAMKQISDVTHNVIELPHLLFSKIRDRLPGAHLVGGGGGGGAAAGASGGAGGGDGDADDDDDGFELLTSEVSGGGDDGEGGISLVFNEVEWLNLLSKISECVFASFIVLCLFD